MGKLATTVRFTIISLVIASVIATWMLLFGLFEQAVTLGTLTQDFEVVLATSPAQGAFLQSQDSLSDYLNKWQVESPPAWLKTSLPK